MEQITIFYKLLLMVFTVAWPFCILSNYLLKKSILSKSIEKDGSGWLAGAVFSSQSSLFGFFSATLVAILVAQRVQIITSSNKEASSLTTLLTLAPMCEKSAEKMIQESIQHYTQHVIEKEWLSMGNHKASWKKGRRIILHLREILLKGSDFSPTASPIIDDMEKAVNIDKRTEKREKNVLDTRSNNASKEKMTERILDRINDLLDRRIERIQSARSHIPSYVWIFLYVATLLVLMGPSFYVLHKRKTHLFMMLAVSIVVCTTLLSLYYLQPRYSGSDEKRIGTIQPEPFKDVLQYIKDHP